MAQLVLTMAGGLLGAAGAPIGISIGAMAGGMVGGWVDSLWMGGGKTHVRAPQYYDSRIQAASYGKIINRCYGKKLLSAGLFVPHCRQSIGSPAR